ncbi:hypothetical protein GCM10028777_04240 [Angustibacter speluncae]
MTEYATHPGLVPAAELATTVLAGAGAASLAGDGHEPVGVLHGLDLDGTPVLLAGPELVRALGLVGEHDDAVARLEVTDLAPVVDLTMHRAQVEVTGWVRLVPSHAVASRLGARSRADLIVAFASWPGARLLELDVAEVVLHAGAGCAHLAPEDLRTALPDPVGAHEAELVQRLGDDLGAALLELVRGIGHAHHVDGGPARPLADAQEARVVGVDRYGLTVLCTLPDDDAAGCCEHASRSTVRVPFPAPVSSAAEAERAALALVAGGRGCPHGC